jgi:hypothetical protein
VEEMNRIVREFRLARCAAMRAVREQYPVGTKVILHGGAVPATVQSYDHVCPDLVNLLFENGNVWTKCVEQFAKK